jgi:putative DNA primase/helicase
VDSLDFKFHADEAASNPLDAELFSAQEDACAAAPHYISSKPFMMDDDGLTKEEIKGGKERTVNIAWVCSPFEILGACRNPLGSEWGKLIRFGDADGRVHMRHISDAELQREPSDLCSALASEGLKINRAKQRDLAEYLSQVTVTLRVTVVDKTGWHDVAGKRVFVLPSEIIATNINETVILDQLAYGPYDAKGSLDDWKNGVGALTAGHTLPVFAICAALAGPLMKPFNTEGGGFHLFASTSVGKSTILQAAASVWGRGSSNGGFVRSWRSTANGLEGIAASVSDTCLVLDELGVGDAHNVAASIYQLANGVGKTRAKRDGSAREPKSWLLQMLSSGELSTETKLGEDRGAKIRGGQTIRLLDVPADRGLGFGTFNHADGFKNAGDLTDAIKEAACSAYGTAGPEFVRRLISSNLDGVAALSRNGLDKFVRDVVSSDASEQVRRAAKKFALVAVAGELAIALGVAPWPKGTAHNASLWAFNRWVEKRGGAGSHEERQAVEQVRRTIEQHGDSHFELVSDNENNIGIERVHHRLGWRKGEGDEREWWIPPESWKMELCAGLDPVFVARALAAKGMLRRQGSGDKNLTRVVKIDGRSIRVYALTSSILDAGEPIGSDEGETKKQ